MTGAFWWVPTSAGGLPPHELPSWFAQTQLWLILGSSIQAGPSLGISIPLDISLSLLIHVVQR